MPQVEASFQQEGALERKRQLRVFHEPQHANIVLFVLRVRHTVVLMNYLVLEMELGLPEVLRPPNHLSGP